MSKALAWAALLTLMMIAAAVFYYVHWQMNDPALLALRWEAVDHATAMNLANENAEAVMVWVRALILWGGVAYLIWAIGYRMAYGGMVRSNGIAMPRRRVIEGHFDDVLADMGRGNTQARIEEARKPNVPHHYAPHLTYAAPKGEHTPPALEGLPVAIKVPTFGEMLDEGMVGKGNPFVLGYDEQGPITGDWKSLYSSGLGGLQGSGKTWTAAFLLAQSALAGAKLVICDPHAGDDESLAIRTVPLAPNYLCDIADDERSILAALKLADDELQRRKQGSPDRWPLIVAVDEWASLRRGKLAEVLPPLIEDFTTEGRKLQCHLMLLSQRWDKASVGDFRNTLASSYIHRMRRDEVRMMTGLQGNQVPVDTLNLQPGEGYLLSTRGDLKRVRIPRMNAADMKRVSDFLNPSGPLPAVTFQPAVEVPGKPVGSPEEARIASLHRAGMDVAAIRRTIWPDVKGGRALQDKNKYVQSVIDTLTTNHGTDR